ncbi:Uncharacterized protein PCOAH_00016500 [Plasmodium coatneyi]|uniref:Variable surface protein n=1 Tax=Plasmodium coatneyi TaxID=208452 RepID=A0A1B1DXP1_9APIC|nr:Uncharacterized protein PCOAH_00016500 [Plasmodium coatneyi]ANQ07510.1 Uncharacterized protein PCOAH_00016500 [Plasmodium coatneyi]
MDDFLFCQRRWNYYKGTKQPRINEKKYISHYYQNLYIHHFHYNTLCNHENPRGMQCTLVHAANSINKRLLTNDPEETPKTVKYEEVSPGSDSSIEEKCNNNGTKLASKTLKEHSASSSNIQATKKKKIKTRIWEFLKKIDKYGEKKTFKYLSYLYNLKKDPNMTKKLFIKKVLRRYGLFIFSPILIKLIVTILPALAHATNIFTTYPSLIVVYSIFHVLVAQILGATSILCLIYFLIKKIKFDMIADKNPKLCYTEYSSFVKHIFI